MLLSETLILALLAGFSIPVGAFISSYPGPRNYCLNNEIDSFVSYFGGGALLAAIALVLVPHGLENNGITVAVLSFLTGGVVFWLLSSWMEKKGSTASQFIGMLLDFIPESIALGSALATGSNTAYLLAVLIALQNMPEGFASFHEMVSSGGSKKNIWKLFILAPFAGPLSAWLGFSFLSTTPAILGSLMLFCSGGILYLIFQDIAPGAHLKNENFPAIGAVSGFLLGMVGTMVIH